jgi:hypothetical protein
MISQYIFVPIKTGIYGGRNIPFPADTNTHALYARLETVEKIYG